MNWEIRHSTFEGRFLVPGDKSVAHRAVLLASLASGSSILRNMPGGQDVLSTISCMEQLGVKIETFNKATRIEGSGVLSAPATDLDSGNSGTTMRLLAGILAGQRFRSRLVGDASLSQRPMKRVIEPLAEMGARIDSSDGRPPLDLYGTTLRGIPYTLPVASAQVKSAVLLAGLGARGETSITERVATRDHTERMMAASGVRVEKMNGTTMVRGGERPNAFELTIPGDMSSAAFLFSAGAVAGGSVSVDGVGINPTRLGFLRTLEKMGVTIAVHDEREEMGEPRGTVTVSGRVSSPVTIAADDVPAIVDELPLVALMASQARGVTVVEGAGELRVKETDRIAGVVRHLSTLGADISELPDGFVVRGPTPLRGTKVASGGDHRLAMMLAVAGLIATGVTVIEGAEAAAVSFPDFETLLRTAKVKIDAA